MDTDDSDADDNDGDKPSSQESTERRKTMGQLERAREKKRTK